MPRISSPVSSRPEYYDRRPTQQRGAVSTIVNEDTAETQRVTVTAAAGRKVFIGLFSLTALVTVAFTSTTANDFIRLRGKLTPSGDTTLEVVSIVLSCQAVVQGDREHSAITPNIVLLPGDEFEGTDFNNGDAVGAGRVESEIMFWGTSFDE